MGNRLSRITTRTGDKGTTGLGDGSRLSKADGLIQCIGEVDELNSWIGLLRSGLLEDDTLQPLLEQIQHDLFDIGGELAVPGMNALQPTIITDLEAAQIALNEQLPPLKEFVLPGGTRSASECHLARSVCRRVERTLVSYLSSRDSGPVNNGIDDTLDSDTLNSNTLNSNALDSNTLDSNSLNSIALPYINRLSDTLFVTARTLARREGNREVFWVSRHQRDQ